MENLRNQDIADEKEILVVSFGTSFNESRIKTIGAIEDEIETNFPDYSVRRAFTSKTILRHLKERYGLDIDNTSRALWRACGCKVKKLVVQPTYMMGGFEYNDLIQDINEYLASENIMKAVSSRQIFSKSSVPGDALQYEANKSCCNIKPEIRTGKPLLSSDQDFEELVDAITADTRRFDDRDTAIVFMGHGTQAGADAVYTKLQEKLSGKGYSNYYIGTVEGSLTISDILKAAEPGGYKRVVLQPLMIVAGDHANNDMAGDDADSWKSIFVRAGYNVETVLKGLGEIEAVRRIFIRHVLEAIENNAIHKGLSH